MPEMVSIVSSNLAAVGYDAAAYVLYVDFRNGGRYRYANVPPEEHAGLMAARESAPYYSHGRYFDARIKRHPEKYPCAEF